MKVIPEHAAVLMIDIQNDYWRPPREPRTSFVDNAAALLAFARRSGLRVVHVQHASRKPNSETFQPGTAGYEIHPAVAALSTEDRVVKHTPGSFHDTGLDQLLRGHEIEQVVIAGMQTQKCCDTTAREASARGYQVVFLADVVETFDLTDHTGQLIGRDEINRVTCCAMANGFATVLTLAELVGSV